MKVKRDTSLQDEHFEIAKLQNGYFTSQQANAVGYKYRKFGYYNSVRSAALFFCNYLINSQL